MSPSNHYSVDHLQRLLLEEDHAAQLLQDTLPKDDSFHILAKNLQQVWRAHGMVAPITGIWHRPLPATLYQCPPSTPQTCLQLRANLPAHIQQQLPSGDNSQVVEVPLSYLQVDEELIEPKNGKRPLLGGINLTNKLSDYTRGVAGQCRPFRAGGMAEENAGEDIDQFLSEEAIQNSMEALEQGAESSWKNGTLLTAPPGVDFKVGLSYEHVYGSAPADTTTDAALNEDDPEPVHILEKEPQQFVDSQLPPTTTTTSKFSLRAPIWTAHDFLDDDSLFGSSEDDSSSSDSGQSDDSAGEFDLEEDAPKVAKGTANYLLDVDSSSSDDDEEDDGGPGKSTGTREKATDSNIPSTEVEEDVDALLEALSQPLTGPKTKTKTKDASANNNNNNPIQLAAQAQRQQLDSNRKQWANTTLLPIKEGNLDQWIPHPAMTFPFTLDNFQQQAIARLERNESVFVAAHTSAGKTVVAEYAVALAQQRATRCIYTSPIKALSNQKFRDFSLKFGAENVGLITGDMQINADDSTCIIMTTEILRSMLYRGADLVRDIEWVIFDEVHYVNDTERGVVWEEVIIMLPAYVNLIFLSATTPNTIEFSDWIGRTKRKPVHVIRTGYRPVPLSHHLWAGLKLHKIMEGNGGFLEKGYSEATKALLPASASKDSSGKKRPGQKPKPTGRPGTGSKQLAWQVQGTKNDWMSLIRFLDREFLTPTVVFSFSKKKCEEIAHMLRSLDMNTAAEKGLVKGFTLQTRARLSELDSHLPQVLTICEMVERGIGVHHGGLLPILKEMVELLFSRNLIKVLFATETFAMGVNMPARAVVFNSIRKHDGTGFRVLQPGEYIQMAGRAGRRGLDTVGTVILCAFGSEPPPMPMLRNMLTGQSTTLQSQFRLTYNMILNLLRVEEMSVESMIKRSFSEFATQRALTANEYPKLLARGTHTLKKLEEQENEVAIGAEDIQEYFHSCTTLLGVNSEILSYVMEATNGTGETVLQSGRALLVTSARKHGLVRAPALVLRPSIRKPGSADTPKLICLVLLPESFVPSSEGGVGAKSTKMPSKVGAIGSAESRFFQILEMGLGEVLVLTANKHKISVKDLLDDNDGPSRKDTSNFFASNKPSAGRSADFDNPFAGMKALGAVGGKKKSDDMTSRAAKPAQGIDQAIRHLIAAEEAELKEGGVPVIDMKEFARCGSDVLEFRQLYSQMEELVSVARSFVSHRHPGLERLYTPIERKETLRTKVEALRHLLSNESLNLFPDFLQRKAVLRKLGYIDDENVAVKGRVACEVNTCDELIATEMVFEGILNDLEPTEIVAALSALVFQDKSGEEELDVELPETLRTCCTQMKTIALNLGQLQKNQGLEIDPLEYCDTTLRFGLVHVVYEWALGVPFRKICELTLVQEGSIVRTITRLDELCREVRNAARVVGNPTLYRKMEAASVAIKRDIVFASSLYVT